MTLMDYYLQFCGELCEGTLSPPDGIALSAETPWERAVELQGLIRDIPSFVRACAQIKGEAIPQSLFDSFREEDVQKALSQISLDVEDEPPRAPDLKPHALEALAASVMLEEGLTEYLIDILRRGDDLSFFRLSQVAARADISPRDFLYWLGHKEDYADEEERSCAALYDGLIRRLLQEDRRELAAALLSGDQRTYEAFRRETPELSRDSRTTYQWFCDCYLDRCYPLRVMLRANGITFPDDLGEKD